MDTLAFLDQLKEHPSYRNQIAHVEQIASRQQSYGELAEPLHPTLHSYLEAAHLLPLYSHQAQAINAARSAKNVFIVTPAASGKTLCYNVPVLDAALNDTRSCALYLFPTKALSQDQLRGLRELFALPQPSSPILALPGLDCAIFDGDTPPEERGEIKRSSRLVLTNPDMLHLGILPNHQSWSRFLHHLRYVVVDEAHVYRGIFGSHVANVLRRLRRLSALYGANPQFICCSATIANPGEHIERLVDLPFEVIDKDGSPYGGKDFVFWNPPVIDRARATRRSANTEATLLLTELVSGGWRTITFARTRKLTELIYIYAREQLAKDRAELAQRIKPYRAGYLPEERRQIERQLFEGDLLGVVATTALELGIDIGSLDATVLTGYPGSIASTWQQAGRSGRGGERSLSFLIALDNPLDQYFMRHPEAFFGKGFEYVLINQANPYILKHHLLCAAWERPLDDRDGDIFGTSFARARDELMDEGLLRNRQRRYYPSPRLTYPAEGVNIRSASSDRYTVVDVSQGNREMETVEAAVAFFQIHPGAIYLHQGESFLVSELDIPSRTAYARPIDADYYTQTKDTTDLSISKVNLEKEALGVKVHLGEVTVTTTVVSFRKRRQFTEEIIGEEPLDLPSQTFPTIALWFDIPSHVIPQLATGGLDLAGGLHATEHAAIALLPLFALCDRNDIGGLSTPAHPDTGNAQVFIYDAYPGGIGIAEKGFELIEQLWQATLKAISECPCESGCPSCIQSPKCGNNNEPLDKRAAQLILEALVRRNTPVP
ncbi:MAG TPA: DEAD/DEAH box helicase [Dehalococcoidia bacterium]|nr:DEAD/DEAH box helicase [Dehalococcoidia bacterium]